MSSGWGHLDRLFVRKRAVYEAVRMNGPTRISISWVNMLYALSEEQVFTVKGVVGHGYGVCN
jgi:hypothetical protein